MQPRKYHVTALIFRMLFGAYWRAMLLVSRSGLKKFKSGDFDVKNEETENVRMTLGRNNNQQRGSIKFVTREAALVRV